MLRWCSFLVCLLLSVHWFVLGVSAAQGFTSVVNVETIEECAKGPALLQTRSGRLEPEFFLDSSGKDVGHFDTNDVVVRSGLAALLAEKAAQPASSKATSADNATEDAALKDEVPEEGNASPINSSASESSRAPGGGGAGNRTDASESQASQDEAPRSEEPKDEAVNDEASQDEGTDADGNEEEGGNEDEAVNSEASQDEGADTEGNDNATSPTANQDEAPTGNEGDALDAEESQSEASKTNRDKSEASPDDDHSEEAPDDEKNVEAADSESVDSESGDSETKAVPNDEITAANDKAPDSKIADSHAANSEAAEDAAIDEIVEEDENNDDGHDEDESKPRQRESSESNDTKPRREPFVEVTSKDKAPVEDEASATFRLELRLSPSLSDINSSSVGPLPAFVKSLVQVLCKSVSLPKEQMRFLSIRGEYIEFDMLQLGNPSLVESKLLQGIHPEKQDDHVEVAKPGSPGSTRGFNTVVDLEVLPSKEPRDRTAGQIFRRLCSQLDDEGSYILRESEISTLLQGASLVLGGPPRETARAAIEGARARAARPRAEETGDAQAGERSSSSIATLSSITALCLSLTALHHGR